MCGMKPCDKPDCTWSEKYKHECLARHLMVLPRDARVNFYAEYLKHHGSTEARNLTKRVNAAYRKQIYD